eukprot:g2822.t1
MEKEAKTLANDVGGRRDFITKHQMQEFLFAVNETMKNNPKWECDECGYLRNAMYWAESVMDKNKDGKISKSELAEWLMKEGKFTKEDMEAIRQVLQQNSSEGISFQETKAGVMVMKGDQLVGGPDMCPYPMY